MLFEYRPKVGLFLKKTISRLLQKLNKKKKMKVKKSYISLNLLYIKCTVLFLFYFIKKLYLTK